MLDSLVTRSRHVIIYLDGRSDAGHCHSCSDPSVMGWEMDRDEQKVYLTDSTSNFIHNSPQTAVRWGPGSGISNTMAPDNKPVPFVLSAAVFCCSCHSRRKNCSGARGSATRPRSGRRRWRRNSKIWRARPRQRPPLKKTERAKSNSWR